MNIIFILGNGFDLTLGLETSYSDFYKYYIGTHNPNFEVERLKKEISKDILNWSDLELALGDYLQHLETPEQFDEIYDDITRELGNYLLYQENSYDFLKINSLDLNKYLLEPEKHLRNAEIQEITEYKDKWSNVDWNVDVITLNYTKSIEKIYDSRGFQNIQIGNHNKSSIILNDVHHVHGYIDSRLVLGVNDNNQLKNKFFHDDTNVQETFIKPIYNQALKHQVDSHCFNLIKTVNLICIFGSSIGKTDLIWWEALGEAIANGAKLLIFHFEKEFLPDNKKIRLERKIRNNFIEISKLSNEFESNIYVSINSEMFSFQ